MTLTPFRCPATWVPPRLTRLDIEPEACVFDALCTSSGQDLVMRGADLWVCSDGTNALSIVRPANAIAKAICVRDLLHETA